MENESYIDIQAEWAIERAQYPGFRVMMEYFCGDTALEVHPISCSEGRCKHHDVGGEG